MTAHRLLRLLRVACGLPCRKCSTNLHMQNVPSQWVGNVMLAKVFSTEGCETRRETHQPCSSAPVAVRVQRNTPLRQTLVKPLGCRSTASGYRRRRSMPEPPSGAVCDRRSLVRAKV